MLVPEESDIMIKLSCSFFKTDWTDESPFCFKAYFQFLDSHPNFLIHLCPLGHWTKAHYSNSGNGNFRCRATLASYPVAASAWMFKQGTGMLLPIQSLWNSWSTACHYGLHVQQGFTVPGALCQTKSVTLLGWGKGSGCVLLWQQPSGWLGSTLPISMGCAAILNSCAFFPYHIQSLLNSSLTSRIILAGRRLSHGMAAAAGLSGLQFRCRREMEKGTGLFLSSKPPLSTCQALVQTVGFAA